LLQTGRPSRCVFFSSVNASSVNAFFSPGFGLAASGIVPRHVKPCVSEACTEPLWRFGTRPSRSRNRK
jgi:hypothetical protein